MRRWIRLHCTKVVKTVIKCSQETHNLPIEPPRETAEPRGVWSGTFSHFSFFSFFVSVSPPFREVKGNGPENDRFRVVAFVCCLVAAPCNEKRPSAARQLNPVADHSPPSAHSSIIWRLNPSPQTVLSKFLFGSLSVLGEVVSGPPMRGARQIWTGPMSFHWNGMSVGAAMTWMWKNGTLADQPHTHRRYRCKFSLSQPDNDTPIPRNTNTIFVCVCTPPPNSARSIRARWTVESNTHKKKCPTPPKTLKSFFFCLKTKWRNDITTRRCGKLFILMKMNGWNNYKVRDSRWKERPRMQIVCTLWRWTHWTRPIKLKNYFHQLFDELTAAHVGSSNSGA